MDRKARKRTLQAFETFEQAGRKRPANCQRRKTTLCILHPDQTLQEGKNTPFAPNLHFLRPVERMLQFGNTEN
jgi:hypothetical protein